jgi:hypothetical protein
VFSLVALAALGQACKGGSTASDLQPGETDFTSTGPDSQGGRAADGGVATGGALPPSAPGAVQDSAGAPAGRVADVQEADIYRIDKNRLFYLNTYRGFVAYDVNDAKNPKLLGRLPVYGYPVEMFVEGTTVYALLRDVLYLTQGPSGLTFQRRNVSQLVTIDVSNPGSPKLLNATDIVGELREGVSRKIDKTIYVVSQIPQWYWYGWQAPGATQPKEQAWVYSFNVTDAQHPALVQKLQLFEGGSVQYYDQQSSYYKTFTGVTIGATSNALMVVENWSVSAWSSGSSSIGAGCGSYESNQMAVVSIVDVSDPSGAIRLHTKFQTAGWLGDQFKHTYVFDDATKTGTYYGIFNRQVWSGGGCSGSFRTQNSLESWDVTNGAAPKRLARLDFGKDQETVRGTTFDVERKVAFAITARQIDPLYALGFEDRANLKILSAIDGLSGDMSVFRPIADKQGGKFLMGIGRDNSGTCTGFQMDEANSQTNIAVSVIDVRDLAKIQLVQRRCVAIQNAAWVGSDISWNLDQAHKMIGMFSDATANVVTVPVSYYKKSDEENGGWWWYGYETAVGIMAWDLGAYDPAKAPADQTVLKNHGTFVHPNGQVLRSILFTHEGSATGAGAPGLPERMMINLSETHMSIASIQDLAAPKLQSVVEIAPYQTAVFRFGAYVVEEVQSQRYYGWAPNQDRTEFRVKAAGGDLEQKAPVATFSLGQVARVFKHGEDKLVALRYIQTPQTKTNPTYVPPTVVAQVYDLSDPAKPRLAGKVSLPSDVYLYYGYWCGDWLWGAYGFYGNANNIISTTSGLVILGQTWTGNAQVTRLVSLDLTNADAPTVTTKTIDAASTWDSGYGLVADPVDPRGFYVTSRKRVGDSKVGDLTLAVYKDYAQRWDLAGGAWTPGAAINLPGRLTSTYASAAGARMFVAQDYRWFWTTDASGYGHGDSTLRLSLLRQTGDGKAELRDSKTFDGIYPSSMVMEGEALMVVGRHQTYGYYYPTGGGPAVGLRAAGLAAPAPLADDSSDRLMTFDLSGGTFASRYDGATGMYGSDLVGVHAGRLLVSLQGDGFLVLDVKDPAAPRGVRFVRTLGWASNIEFSGSDVYVASGYFGIQHFGVGDPVALATTSN